MTYPGAWAAGSFYLDIEPASRGELGYLAAWGRTFFFFSRNRSRTWGYYVHLFFFDDTYSLHGTTCFVARDIWLKGTGEPGPGKDFYIYHDVRHSLGGYLPS